MTQKGEKKDLDQQEYKNYGAYLSELGIILNEGEYELIGEKMAQIFVMNGTGQFIKYPRSIEQILNSVGGFWSF